MCGFISDKLKGVTYRSVSTNATNIVPLTIGEELFPKTRPPGCVVNPVVLVFKVNGVYVVLSCDIHATNFAGPVADVLVV